MKRRCNAFPSGQVLSQSVIVFALLLISVLDSYCVFLLASFIQKTLASLPAFTGGCHQPGIFTAYGAKIPRFTVRYAALLSSINLPSKIHTLSIFVLACACHLVAFRFLHHKAARMYMLTEKPALCALALHGITWLYRARQKVALAHFIHCVHSVYWLTASPCPQ